jgi:hypothetical protein
LKRRQRKVPIPRGIPIGVPDRVWVRLAYADRRDVTPGTGGSSGWAVRVNGAYDPDATGTGAQPRFWDQWTAMFASYCVESATIEATFISTASATATGQSICGIDIRPEATLDTSSTGYMEGRLSKWKVHSASGGGLPVVRMRRTMDVADWFGVPQALDRYDLKAAYNAVPASSLHFHLFCSDPDPATSSSDTTWVDMRVTYTLRFFDPITPALS